MNLKKPTGVVLMANHTDAPSVLTAALSAADAVLVQLQVVPAALAAATAAASSSSSGTQGNAEGSAAAAVAADALLTAPSRLLPLSTVGKHLRHAADHYAALLDWLDRRQNPTPPPLPNTTADLPAPASATGAIVVDAVDYDTRLRNTPFEAVLASTADRLASLRARLAAFSESGSTSLSSGDDAGAPVPVRCVVDQDAPAVIMPSSVARELWF
ncbi:hypothetical protein HK405_012182, partial [Cladochytrium tenue]